MQRNFLRSLDQGPQVLSTDDACHILNLYSQVSARDSTFTVLYEEMAHHIEQNMGKLSEPGFINALISLKTAPGGATRNIKPTLTHLEKVMQGNIAVFDLESLA